MKTKCRVKHEVFFIVIDVLKGVELERESLRRHEKLPLKKVKIFFTLSQPFGGDDDNKKKLSEKVIDFSPGR